MGEYYDFLDDQINTLLNITVGFNCLLGSDPYRLDKNDISCFSKRYHLIKEFQNNTLSLFKASLRHEFDPELAVLVINELPENQGWEYHKKLTPQQNKTPVFFRTDEVVPGKISEVQCPGSLWGLYEQLYSLGLYYGLIFGVSTTFPQSLSENFSAALKKFLGIPPVLHHISDNASIPHDVRFFIQKTRKYDLKYFSYDKGVTPYNCNFVRAHDFVGLFYNNFAKQRLLDCNAGLLHYDFPPSILFEEKISLIFPFWKKTRDYYTDEIREIFPYADLITPEGFYLEDGTRITPEQFCSLPRAQRNYYIKYAGSDISLNWGSKGVYFAGSLSRTQCGKLFDDIVKGYKAKKYWIVQKGYSKNETTSFITRENEIVSEKVHSKFSGFYGPDGLMGILIMQRPFYKVHGNPNTIVALCK